MSLLSLLWWWFWLLCRSWLLPFIVLPLPPPLTSPCLSLLRPSVAGGAGAPPAALPPSGVAAACLGVAATAAAADGALASRPCPATHRGHAADAQVPAVQRRISRLQRLLRADLPPLQVRLLWLVSAGVRSGRARSRCQLPPQRRAQPQRVWDSAPVPAGSAGATAAACARVLGGSRSGSRRTRAAGQGGGGLPAGLCGFGCGGVSVEGKN